MVMANPLHTKVTPKATHGENNIKDLLVYSRTSFRFNLKLLNCNAPIPSFTLQQYSVKQEQEDDVLQIDL